MLLSLGLGVQPFPDAVLIIKGMMEVQALLILYQLLVGVAGVVRLQAAMYSMGGQEVQVEVLVG